MIVLQKSVYSSPHYDADPVWTEDGRDSTFFNDIYFHPACTTKYRVTEQVSDLSWVDLHLGCSPLDPTLLGQWVAKKKSTSQRSSQN